MKKGGGIFKSLILATVASSLLVACSQARRGIGNKGAEDQIWSEQKLCAVPTGFDLLGCFDISLNVTLDVAYFKVGTLGFNPSLIPYRVMAKKYRESTWVLLANNITEPTGSEFEVAALPGDKIAEYEFWRVELTVYKNSYGDWGVATPGSAQAAVVAQMNPKWPEFLAYSQYNKSLSSAYTSNRAPTSR